MDAVLVDLMGGRLAAGTRALINQVSVDANVDVLWLDVTEIGGATADALIAVIDNPDTPTSRTLPSKSPLPLVGLLAGAATEEQSLALTRCGYEECLILAELTPTRLHRSVRMAVARSGSRPSTQGQAKRDPHSATTVNLAESCPHCRAPIKPEFVVCRICGARLTL